MLTVLTIGNYVALTLFITGACFYLYATLKERRPPVWISWLLSGVVFVWLNADLAGRVDYLLHSKLASVYQQHFGLLIAVGVIVEILIVALCDYLRIMTKH